IREAIVNACKGDLSKWPEKVPHAFFADKITTRRQTGFSPYYLLHGVDPMLPFDLTESTILTHGQKPGMTSVELMAHRIAQLHKHALDLDKAAETLAKSRFKIKERFEQQFSRKLFSGEFQPGDLVLVRNTAIEEELNRKTQPRYLGPYVVVRRTQGGSYVLSEMDGTVLRNGVAAFRVIPYL
ncbi:hypothetical protein BD410DRAFT_695988, partial [Rickenella mellea]